MAGPSVEFASLSACRSQATARRWGRRAQYQVWNFSYTVLRVRSKKWASRIKIGPAGACSDKNHALSHARAQGRSPHGATAPSLASRATAGSARASPPKRGARRRKRNAGTPVPIVTRSPGLRFAPSGLQGGVIALVAARYCRRRLTATGILQRQRLLLEHRLDRLARRVLVDMV